MLGIIWGFSLLLSIKIVSWKLVFAPFWVYKPKQILKTQISCIQMNLIDFLKYYFKILNLKSKEKKSLSS